MDLLLPLATDDESDGVLCFFSESWQELANDMVSHFNKAMARFVDRGHSSSDEDTILVDGDSVSRHRSKSGDKRSSEAAPGKKRGKKRKADERE